jgi:hypothetical protein
VAVLQLLMGWRLHQTTTGNVLLGPVLDIAMCMLLLGCVQSSTMTLLNHIGVSTMGDHAYTVRAAGSAGYMVALVLMGTLSSSAEAVSDYHMFIGATVSVVHALIAFLAWRLIPDVKSTYESTSSKTHHALPSNSYSIWASHMEQNKMQLAGVDDQIFNFYIDPGNSFDWACMNALYKNSYLDVKWFIYGKKLVADDTVYKIQLDNFLVDCDCFLSEFLKVTDIIGHSTSESEIQAVKILYNQWRTTILERNNIETFKKNIGFSM